MNVVEWIVFKKFDIYLWLYIMYRIIVEKKYLKIFVIMIYLSMIYVYLFWFIWDVD